MILDKPQLSFEIVYSAADLLQVEALASNGRFAGVTTFFTEPDGKALINLGHSLQGFPKIANQVVECEFGFTQKQRALWVEEHPGNAFDLSYLGLKFSCIDKAGHTAVDIIIEEGQMVRESAQGRSSFKLLFDPASLDQFVLELLTLGEQRQGKAVLLGNIDNVDHYA